MVEAVRILYRARQFRNALFARPSPQGLERARALLSPSLFELFARMQDSEQAHSLQVMEALCASGEQDHELLAAALLHDAGKSRRPLRAWERVVIVLAQAVFPGRMVSWGRGAARGWRAAFVVAREHPAWGAALAREAGASARVVSLIRRHQDPPPREPLSFEDRLLLKLQQVDDES